MDDYSLNGKWRRAPKGNNSRAHNRRVKEKFYEKYITGRGIDIGCTSHERSISPTAQLWDLRTHPGGDATLMNGISDNTYNYVLASHILEHLDDLPTAITNWFRIVKPGGHLIICVPERDLYELKKELPSDFNVEHAWYFKLDQSELPATQSFKGVLEFSLPENSKIEYIKVCGDGWEPIPHKRTSEMTQNLYPVGEFQIEAVIKKLNKENK